MEEHRGSIQRLPEKGKKQKLSFLEKKKKEKKARNVFFQTENKKEKEKKKCN